MAILAGGMIFTSCTKNFTVTVSSNNEAWGTVTGGGTYADGATATLTATPKTGYQFVQWNDGDKTNPREVVVKENITYTATFEAITPGVKVTFNNAAWDASAVSGKWYTNYSAWALAAAQTSLSELPQAQLASFVTSGNVTATADANGGLGDDFAYVEYWNETYLVDGDQNTYGDWWGKNITLKVTAFDATAMTITSEVSGTMFSALEAFVPDAGAVGVDAASTAPMTVKATNIELTAAKGTLKKVGAKNLVAAK
jgi:hypothetical protein